MRALRSVAVAGTGASVPERVVTNADLARIVETDDAWIVSRTGIKERRLVESVGPGAGTGTGPNVAPHPLPTTNLAADAARRALESAGFAAAQLDAIIVGTCTPDYAGFPATAPLLASKIGAAHAFGFDVSLACTGFVAALMIGEKLVAAGPADSCLVIGVDVMSYIMDWTDRNTCVIFADGAGAVLLKRAEPGARGEILHSSLGMQGEAEVLFVDPRTRKMRMKGRETFKFAVQKFVAEIEKAAAAAGVAPADLAAIVPHQVNRRIIEAAVERLKIPLERVVVNIDRYGNTSAGSVPIALDEAARGGRLKAGDLVCLVAFGGGLSWGAALVRW